MVYRMQVIYDEIVGSLDVKYITGLTIGYTKPLGIYEIIDMFFMLKSLVPYKVKVKSTIKDI